MTLLPHLAARLFGVPLAIHSAKLDLILAVLGPRVGVVDLEAPSGFALPERAPSAAPPGIALIAVHQTRLNGEILRMNPRRHHEGVSSACVLALACAKTRLNRPGFRGGSFD